MSHMTAGFPSFRFLTWNMRILILSCPSHIVTGNVVIFASAHMDSAFGKNYKPRNAVMWGAGLLVYSYLPNRTGKECGAVAGGAGQERGRVPAFQHLRFRTENWRQYWGLINAGCKWVSKSTKDYHVVVRYY